MRIHGVHDGSLYASEGRTVLVERDDETFERLGRVPLSRDLSSLVLAGPADRVVERLLGPVRTVNLWRLTDDDWLATVGYALYRSADCTRSWTRVRDLPDSSGTAGLLSTAICRHDGDLYLGEYPLAHDATPRILRSTDGGWSWATVLSVSGVRHIHSLTPDPHSGHIWVTTGDTDAASRIGYLRDDEFVVVGQGSQRWRAVEPALTSDAIIWGMDSAYADRRRILKLPRSRIGAVRPEPDSLCPVDGPVYYADSFELDGDCWVVFSTAVEPGADSTGPAKQDYETTAVVVAASSATRFREWHELARFDRRRSPLERLYDGAPAVNAYVFIAASSGRGLFVNPYNTHTRNGEVLQITPEQFERLSAPTVG